jgi:chemotaxis protein MotB
MAGKGGGAWKVAYADFVTAMMAFFMVMWLTGQKEDVKMALSEYFRDPWARYRLNNNDVRNPTMRDPKAGDEVPDKKYMGSNPKLEPHDDPESKESRKTKIITVRASERSTAGTVVTFAPEQTSLNGDAKDRLKVLSKMVDGLNHKIEIRGHVSPRAKQYEGDDAEIWLLCQQRCMSVKRYLEQSGVAADRLRLSQAGPHEPLTLDTPQGEIDKNSRVEVFMLDETVSESQGTPKERDEIVQRALTEPIVEQAPADAGGHGGGHGGGH